MSGSFLDTTVVVELAEESDLAKTWGRPYIAINQPAQAPYYALKELLTGRVRNLCDAHNRLQASENVGEALMGLSRMPGVAGRKKDAAIQSLAGALNKVFETNPSGGRDDIKREMLQDLALKVSRLWRNARKTNGVTTVQPLACFNNGSLSHGPTGELRGPADSFNCLESERCAAAAYIHDNGANLSKLIDALHPDNLDPMAAAKNENQKRRKALKELKQAGPTDFRKANCRALGDAYFAAMCPAGSAVLTTNSSDHLPLCVSLGIAVVSPK